MGKYLNGSRDGEEWTPERPPRYTSGHIGSIALGRRTAEVSLGTSVTLAPELVQANDYDLVLMDVQMPEMNGYDATRAIRALPGPKGRLPVLAMTANVMREELERTRLAGMDGFVPKPFQRGELLEALRHVLVNRNFGA